MKVALMKAVNDDPGAAPGPEYSVLSTQYPGLTEQQGAAVSRREVSVVLSSGAGCGKTHVLTERYLSHLREGAEVGQIVAITFTDRAARQMRERIRRAVLHELRTAQGEDEIDRWARHLRGLETAQVSTIHAFCGALLRQHAVQAGLDPLFDVLDEVMAANLRAEAHADALQELLTSQSVAGDDLRELVLLYGWRPAVAAVEHLVAAADEPAWQDWLRRPAEDLACRWVGDDRRELLPRYVSYLVTAAPRIARCLWLLRTTECVGPKTRANVRRLLDETPRLASAPDLAPTVAGLTEAAKVGKERGKAWKTEADYEAVKKAFEGFRGDLAERVALFTEAPEGVAEAAAVGQRFLRVAAEAVQAYRRRKRRAGAVDFADLLFMARDLLRDQPDVREALQGRYRYLLVDELQDTDPIQMEVVEHLCGGGLTAGKLFGVGDWKQSIYRFRGADASLFRRLRQSMPHDGRLGLTVNFRSQPAILHFVNALFSRHIAEYEPLRPHHSQVNPGPCAEFLWSPRQDKESATDARNREADAIARRIAAMTAGEQLVTEGEGAARRPRLVRPGDVVLLFRSMSNVALYEAALRRRGLDYYLVGGRAFFAQQEIYDLLNLLRALENPRDEVALAGTLRSPFCCLSDEALFLLARHHDGPWAGLQDDATLEQLPEDQRPAAARARRHLGRWHALKDRQPIARLLSEVFADSGYDAAMLFEFLGDRKLANLWKLQEMARAFDRTGLFGLAEFIGRLGDLVSRQPREEQAATRPESADVVRLMTIHQAKGLEFPVVFVPDLAARAGGMHQPVAHWDARLGCVVRPPAGEEPPPFSDFPARLWKAREAVEEWHEDLRTLYVACTRAQDYLVLSASLPDSFAPETAWMLALAERFDLRGGACLAEDVPPGEVPQVRVTDGATLSFSRERPASAEAALAGRSRLNECASVAPVAVRLSGKRLFTVAEIESYRNRATKRPLHAEKVAPQFDTEDGSDRREWEGVGPALVQDEWLKAELGRARSCRRNVEFLLEVPGEGAAVRGRIDCLWEDTEGGRHLLVLTSGRRPTKRCRSKSEQWPLGPTLAAVALHRQTGAWPASVTVYDPAGGAALRGDGGALPHEEALAAVAAAVSGLRRETLPA
jgi:ATP-dependent helicase/nuclease subunit A